MRNATQLRNNTVERALAVDQKRIFLNISSNKASWAVVGWLGISGRTINGSVAKNGWLGRLAVYKWQMTRNNGHMRFSLVRLG